MAKRPQATTPETSEYLRNMALGIQSELDRKGMSVNQLASTSGISVATIRAILEREYAAKLITVEKLCQALDVDAGQIFLRGHVLWLERRLRPPASRPPIFIMPFPGE